MSTAANPRANNPQDGGRETTGTVTSDSLAAESIKADGGFAENDAAISSVKGSNSTLNTTDTSGASELHAARDRESREQDEPVQYPDSNPKFSGITSPEGYVGGPSGSTSSGSKSTSGNTSSKSHGVTGDSFGPGTTSSSASDPDPNIRSGSSVTSGANKSSNSGSRSHDGSDSRTNPIATGRAGEDFGTASRPDSDTAPNYAATVSGAIQREGEGKPKGENLTEGGIPETKTFTGNVGGSKDPGRLAEKDFDKMGDGSLGGSGEKQHSTSSSGGAFDVLSSEKI